MKYAYFYLQIVYLKCNCIQICSWNEWKWLHIERPQPIIMMWLEQSHMYIQGNDAVLNMEQLFKPSHALQSSFVSGNRVCVLLVYRINWQTLLMPQSSLWDWTSDTGLQLHFLMVSQGGQASEQPLSHIPVCSPEPSLGEKWGRERAVYKLQRRICNAFFFNQSIIHLP